MVSVASGAARRIWARSFSSAAREPSGNAARYSSTLLAVATAFVEAHPDRVDELLLHEMVHVATRSGHGPPFRREWQRLKVAGAPVSHVYREFRHCPQFAPGRPRPYLYRCPQCDAEFPRTRPFREPRWCASCERGITSSS